MKRNNSTKINDLISQKEDIEWSLEKLEMEETTAFKILEKLRLMQLRFSINKQIIAEQNKINYKFKKLNDNKR